MQNHRWLYKNRTINYHIVVDIGTLFVHKSLHVRTTRIMIVFHTSKILKAIRCLILHASGVANATIWWSGASDIFKVLRVRKFK